GEWSCASRLVGSVKFSPSCKEKKPGFLPLKRIFASYEWRCETFRTLVVLGRNHPSPSTVQGRPLYVHWHGVAMVWFKDAMQARMRARQASTDVTVPRCSPRRPTLLHQRAIWCRQLVWCGVERQRRRWLPSRQHAARVAIDCGIPRGSVAPRSSVM